MNLSYFKKIISPVILVFGTTQQLISMRVTVIKETTVTKEFLTPYGQFKNGCKEIDKKQKQKMNSFIGKHNAESTHDQHIKIETKLRGLQSSIDILEKGIMYSLQQELSIDDRKWGDILLVTKEIQLFEDNNKHLPLPDATHDKSIPKMLRRILKTCLVDKKINPKRITIETNTKNQYYHAIPTQRWSFSPSTLELSIDPTQCHPGIIGIPQNYSFSYGKQKALGLLLAHIIDEKKLIFYAIAKSLTAEDVVKSKSRGRYCSTYLPLGMIGLALKDRQAANLLCTSLKKMLFSHANDAIITAGYCYKLMAKIRRCWNIKDWLENYDSLHASLTFKDPMQEFVTHEELERWKKEHNNPLCLPVRNTNPKREHKSYNPFDVLKTQSFNKECMMQLEILYNFLSAVIKNQPIYEYLPSTYTNGTYGYSIKRIGASESSIAHLRETFGDESIEKALTMANYYAAQAHKEFIYF